LEALLAFLEDFVSFKELTNVTVIGNSLGGHIGLLYTLKNQDNVHKLVLTGSSGLFENSMGGSFPKRGSYDYIKERVAYTFYDPKLRRKILLMRFLKPLPAFLSV
jgi:pimeloyl-ACP methyl ester carboxylesterase